MESSFGYDSALSTEWLELVSLWSGFNKIVALPIRLANDNAKEKDKDPTEFGSYSAFMNHVIESGKKGNYIQRYKGLGEMNPVQLWETTLNPENRTLLKVSIDDVIAADETFSVLMGEQVEPRRKFIHDNALLARELDV
jgi:DNA gyrase subunit B